MQHNEIPDTAYTNTWTGGRGEVAYFTRSDGSRLRYLTVGSGPPLVLLHTVRTQLDYFQRVIPLLWDSYTIYAVDLPGMGWSDIVADAKYEEPDLRAAVVEFVAGLDLYGVTLAGESMGAAIALSASIDLKERITRVVAFNSYDYKGGLERGNWLARLIGTSTRLPGSGAVFARMEVRPLLLRVMRGGFVDPSKLPTEFVVELRRSGGRKGYPRVVRAIMRSLKGFVDARRRYAEVPVPVTLIYSEHDWSHPSEREYVAGLLPQAQRITLPGCGHFSALERPSEMARILGDLAKLQQGSGA
ncbi:alpha/beta hydrolase [Mycobacterium fragae]|uniref:Alpha/beta hydrolase n=1 Tax=Mycobacterium fragae TaxID=1260918 RepID=A0A1X1UMK6_9MYCO|nr:alpha/beta hydrolase [Mycobacterium fragae]MCV7402712.1 alpha/beta hydrolase [Mycobacterium fragae]ORV58011.1 alpha/beta hydrolase [Mycobacterium fragae]